MSPCFFSLFMKIVVYVSRLFSCCFIGGGDSLEGQLMNLERQTAIYDIYTTVFHNGVNADVLQ